MSGRWKALLEWLTGHWKRKEQAKDMKPAPRNMTEEAISFILRRARDMSSGKSPGANIIVSARDLPKDLVVDLTAIASQVMTRAKCQHLLGGEYRNGKFHFEKE